MYGRRLLRIRHTFLKERRSHIYLCSSEACFYLRSPLLLCTTCASSDGCSLFGKFQKSFCVEEVTVTLQAVRDHQGMHDRRAQIPSPIKQHILWSTSLKGMERPVRSFKSFIRTAPTRLDIEKQKPLPPTPASPGSPLTDDSSSTTVPTSPDGSPSLTSWKPPTEWEWDNPSPPCQPIKTTSLFPARTYSPLIPEPSPALPDMQSFDSPRSSAFDFPRSPRLQTIDESLSNKPAPPPRNPSRLSFFRSASDESDPESMTRQTISRSESSSSLNEEYGSCLDLSAELQLHTAVTRASESNYRSSDPAARAKAFASLGIGSARNTKNGWEGRIDEVYSSQAEPDVPRNLSGRGSLLNPSDIDAVIRSNDIDSAVLKTKFQQLSVSQDYHNVLTTQYHDHQTQSSKRPSNRSSHMKLLRPNKTTQMKPAEQDSTLVPQPLAWRKGSDKSSLGVLEPAGVSTAKGRGMHKRLASLVTLPYTHAGNRRYRLEVPQPRAAGRAPGPKVKQTPEAKNGLVSKGTLQFPHFSAHHKGVKYYKQLTRATSSTETTKAMVQHSSPHSSPRSQRSVPIMRLPGGLMLVRQSPPETLNGDHIPDHKQRSGLQNPAKVLTDDLGPRPSGDYDTETVTNERLHNSILAPSRPHSSESSRQDSILAQELARPRTPPPIPLRRPRIPQPLPSSLPPYPSSKELAESYTIPIVQEEQKSSFLNKAKEVRHAWRNHQREIKHDRIKQSIRVLGPTESTDLSKIAVRTNTGATDGVIAHGRVPGYLIAEPL